MVDGFNDRIAKVVVLGPVAAVDESFSMWYGLSGETSDGKQHRFASLPHNSFIPDKPRGQGTMFKCLADGLTRIITTLEIQEGKSRMAMKEYQARPTNVGVDQHYLDMKRSGDIHKFGTAVTLRLTNGLTGTVLVGDDAFTSVALAEAAMRRGLEYIGNKKRKSIGFPFEYLEDEAMKLQTGQHVSATTQVQLPNGDVRTILGVGFKATETVVNTFLSTVGSTAPGTEIKRRKRTLAEFKNDIQEVEGENPPIREPRLLEEMRRYSHAIDDNNNMRQGIQKIEENWKTQRFEVRIFSTIFGMILANAFLCYGYEQQLYHAGEETLTYHKFLDKLVVQLCPKNETIPVIESAQDPNGTEHSLRSLSELPMYQGRRHYRRKCKVCHQNCSHYCVACTSRGDIFAVHDPNNRLSEHKDCFKNHLQRLEEGEHGLDEAAAHDHQANLASEFESDDDDI